MRVLDEDLINEDLINEGLISEYLFSVSLAAVSIFGPALIASAGAVHVTIRVAVSSFAGILFHFRWA